MAIAETSQTIAPFVRHRGPVTCVAHVPGTGSAVTSAYDGAVAWFDLQDRSVELLGYHDHLVNRVTVNRDGTLAASSSSDFTIGIWDLRRRCLLSRLIGHSDDVEDFAFVDEGRGISVSRDWRVLVWNLKTGAVERAIEGHGKDVLSVVYHKGRIFTAGDDMTLRVWDLESGRLIKMWGPFETETDTCAIDTIHGRAVLGCDDGVIRVFDIESGEMIAALEAHASGIKKVATSPTNGDILSAAYDQEIHVWDAQRLERRLSLEHRRTTWERSFNWTADGSRILAGTFDGTVLLWDAASGACLDEIGHRDRGNPCLNDVAAGRDGRIATVSDDGIVRLGRLTAAQAAWEREMEPASGRMLANAICLDERTSAVITGTHDHKVHIFDLRNDIAAERELALGQGPINCLRVAHHPGHEDEVFAACYSGAIVRIGIGDGSVRGIYPIHDGAVKALRLHPTEPMGVSCSADGGLLSWSFDGSVAGHFLGHMGIVDDVDIDPLGTMIASVSRDFTLKVFSLAGTRLLHTISLGRRSPKGILFYDPRTVIVTNYWGALLRVDLESERVTSHQFAKNGISAVNRNGDQLVAVSYDGTAYLVRPDDLEVVNRLSTMTQRLEPSPLF